MHFHIAHAKSFLGQLRFAFRGPNEKFDNHEKMFCRCKVTLIGCWGIGDPAEANPLRGSGVGKGGPEKVFLVTNVFHRGPCGPPLRCNWTPEGVRISIAIRKHEATREFSIYQDLAFII